MEVLKSIIKNIDISSASAVGFYNDILGLESSVLGNMNQINKVIQTLSFIQGVQNAMLKNAILKIQDKYTLMTGVIVDLTNKRREYLSKMMEVVTNKQKILQQIAQHTISQARNPLSGFVNDLSGNRDLLALLRAYYQQSANFMKFQDAREVVNHRLNSMYAMVNSLQAQFVRAVQDYMDYDTVIRIDNLSNANKISFKRLSDLEGSLVSTEESILTAETDLSVKLGFPGVMLDMVGGSGYIDRLAQAFTEIAGGQDGGAIDATRVALLPSVVPRLNDVDMVSFGGILNDRLAQCQRAYSIMAERNENQGDYNTLELALLTGTDANKALVNVMQKLSNYKLSMEAMINLRNNVYTAKDGDLDAFGTPAGPVSSPEVQLKRLHKIVDKQYFENYIETHLYKSFVKSLKERILHNARTSPSDKEKTFAFGEEAKKLSKEIDDKIEKAKFTPAQYKEPIMTGGKKRRAAKKSSGKKRGGAKKKSSKKRSSSKKSSGKRRGGSYDQDGGKKKKRSAKKSSPKRRGGAVGGAKKKRSSKKRSSGRKH